LKGCSTQRAKILSLLTAARGGWVPLPEILELKVSQYGTRILELRRSGHKIENKTETVNGKRHSWFRLNSAPAVQRPPESLPLFSEGGRG